MEYWEAIQDFEGLYEISSYGRVRSRERKSEDGRILRGRILKTHHNTRNGYVYISLHKNKKIFTCTVHRLVARAFLDNSSNLPEINHKNGDKTDNRLENLEWCTSKDNHAHAFSTGLRSYNTPATSKRVEMRSMSGELLKIFPSAAEAARCVGAWSSANISAAARGRLRSSCGYVWRYVTD